MLDIKALEKQQRAILDEVRSALKGSAFEKGLSERPAALHEARRATLVGRMEALEEERKRLSERIDSDISRLREEIEQVEGLLKSARAAASPADGTSKPAAVRRGTS